MEGFKEHSHGVEFDVQVVEMDNVWSQLLVMDYKTGLPHNVEFKHVIDSGEILRYPVVDGKECVEAASSGKLAALEKAFGHINLYEDLVLGLSVQECTPLSCVGGEDLFKLHELGGDNPDWLVENLSMAGRDDRFLLLTYPLLRSMHNVWFGYNRITDGVRLYLNHNDFSPQHSFATYRLDFYDDHVEFFRHGIPEAILGYVSMRKIMFGGAYACQ